MQKFYKNRKVLVTGHTGFKGTWLCKALLLMGAEVTGYALEASIQPSLFSILELEQQMNSIIGDIRDLSGLQQVFDTVKPEVVIHMAAQPIVRESYMNPVYTYDVNVMGTVNVLECIRKSETVQSFINVTTDKVYKNREWEWGYRENEELCGFDPYSNSKSCSELVTESYKNSFFGDREIAITTMRAGNVIGGGDFAKDRIVPDCVRSAWEHKDIVVRNPYSIRPYQHVLEPVMAYLMVAARQYEDQKLAGNYNIGPNECDCIQTGELVQKFCDIWEKETGEAIGWCSKYDGGPHEAHFLKLDCSHVKDVFGWQPRWGIDKALLRCADIYGSIFSKEDTERKMCDQIKEYSNFGDCKEGILP